MVIIAIVSAYVLCGTATLAWQQARGNCKNFLKEDVGMCLAGGSAVVWPLWWFGYGVYLLAEADQ